MKRPMGNALNNNTYMSSNSSSSSQRRNNGARNNQDNRTRKKRRNPLGGEVVYVDYFDTKGLERFLNDQGKILPRRITGVTAKQQRMVTTAVKYARHLALLPFVELDMR